MSLRSGRVGVSPSEVDHLGHLKQKSVVNPIDKTADMTQPVGVDSTGKLFTAPAGLTHQYSLQDQLVGKWIDGTNVYERIIPLTNNLSDDLTELKISAIIKLDAYGGYTGIKFTMDSVSGTVQRALYYNTSDHKIHVDGSATVTHVIMQYIKSS